MAHQHGTENGNPFKLGLVLNSGFTVLEFIAGILSGSLALVADATHNLTDSLTLAIAYIADRISRRQPDTRRTYGYGRAKIIASLLNAGVLIAVAIFIGYEAIERLNEPKEVPGLVVALVAAIGIAINGGVAYLFSKNKHDLNSKAAYTSMLYDMLSSVGALIAGLAIAIFNINWLDSVVGIGIALMLLSATIGIVKDAFRVLLEGVPEDIDIEAVKSSLTNMENIIAVDDVHAWTIDNDYYAFSCHLIVNEKHYSDSRKLVELAKTMLYEKYNFKHSTIEVELEDCVTHTDHEQLH